MLERISIHIFVFCAFFAVPIFSDLNERSAQPLFDAWLDNKFKQLVQRNASSHFTECRKAGAQSVPGLDSIVISLISVEMDARPRFRRTLENWWASLHLKLLGRLPDISLGKAQLRPGTVKRILATTNSHVALADHDVFNALNDDCRAYELVSIYVVGMTNRTDLSSLSRYDVARIAKAYNGQVTESSESRAYNELVWRMFDYQSNMVANK